MSDSSHSLDEIDRELLCVLQTDARLSNAALARRVELSPSGLQKRLRKLESLGLIDYYAAILNRATLGYNIMAFIHISLLRHQPDSVQAFRYRIQMMDEVVECHNMTGQDDYLLKVIVRDVQHLQQFLHKKLADLPAIDRVRTSIVLDEVKSTTAIPLPNDGV